jgi:disulfide bond formation protein DsbB
MLIRLLNLLGLLGVSLVLLAAFYYQLFQNEPPCPLCLLQRGCFVALGIGFALNLSVGPSRLHDAMMLVSGLLGAGTALRQWLLHIAPGDAGYGSPMLGAHFYTWAFVAFAASILYVALLLLVEAREGGSARRQTQGAGLLGRLALWLFLLVVGGNLVSTLLECGFGACAANPTFYEWLGPRAV